MDPESEGTFPVLAEQTQSREVDLTPFSADLAEMDLGVALARVERRIDFVKRAKALALRITDPGDWKDMGGKPYLEASGCRKLKPVFRVRYVSWQIEPTLADAVRKMRDNEAVSFLVTGIARCEATGEESCFIGGRSSGDGFFGAKPQSEIDVLDVMKAAVTNWEHRAVCGLLGLDNLAWEDLLPYGIKPSGRVDYKARPKAPEVPAQAAPVAKISPAEMRQMISQRLTREEKDPAKALETLTRGRFTTLQSLDKASPEQIRWLFDKLFPRETPDAA